MARRTQPTPSLRPSVLSFEDLKRGIIRLERRISEVEAFAPESIGQENVPAIIAPLRASIEDSLGQTFGHESVEYNRYEPAAQFGEALRYTFNHQQVVEVLQSHKKKALALLKQAISSLKERLEDSESPAVGKPTEMSDLSVRKIFVVHGQDTGARERVARFLESAGLEPIVLHEQVNQGRTIIEKFEEHSAVRFAIVLLTPDDFGGRAGGSSSPRARQNVILELGYFIGKLGRDRVCALKGGELELPSDILGVVWTPFDEAEGWRVSLAKELQAAGFAIDWNKVMTR